MGNFKEDIARCEAFVFDVDGVMTDGSIVERGTTHDVLNDPHLGYAIAFGMIALTAVANGIYIFLRMRAERWVK